MGRKFSTSSTADRILYKGSWFELHQVTPRKDKPRELFVRISGEHFACKALVLHISKEDSREYGLKKPIGRCRPKKFAKLVENVIEDGRVNVPFLAVKRPILHVPELGSNAHYLYEFGGGVAHNGEDNVECGVREATEELGMHGRQILAYSKLLVPSPFDSGSHAEMVGICVVLCQGKFRPPNREGIIQKRCRLIQFNKVKDFVRKKRKKGVIVEGYVDCAMALFNSHRN